MQTLDEVAEALLGLAIHALPAKDIDAARINMSAGEDIEAVEDLLVELSWRSVRVPEDILEVVERTAPAEWRPPTGSSHQRRNRAPESRSVSHSPP